MLPRSVLLVDPDPSSSMYLRNVLERAGHDVLVAAGSDEALALARRGRPGLILVEVMLAGSDGFTLLRELQADPTLAAIPVIILADPSQHAKVIPGWSTPLLGIVPKPAPRPVGDQEWALFLSRLERALARRRPSATQTGVPMSQIITLTAATMRDPNNEVARRLRDLGYTVRCHPDMLPPDAEQLRALLAGAVGVIAGPEAHTRAVMEASPELRVISRNGVGYDAVDLDAATDLGIVVAFTPDAMVDTVADLAMGLLLSLARRIVQFDRSAKAGEWNRSIAFDIHGKTLGLVGTGRIGLATARRAKAFGMHLLGCDPYPNPLFIEELGGNYVPLEELLAVSDFVSLHVPATSASRNLIGKSQIALMKQSAFLINTARGTLVDEEALLEALRADRIAGAGLDVYSKEPPDAGSPAAELMRLPNVVALPHVASYTPDTARRMGLAALENLLAALRGERPTGVANPEVYDRGLRPSLPHRAG